jgi:hypothetical protein
VRRISSVLPQKLAANGPLCQLTAGPFARNNLPYQVNRLRVLILALNPAVTHGTARSPGTFHEFTSAAPGCLSGNRGRLHFNGFGRYYPGPRPTLHCSRRCLKPRPVAIRSLNGLSRPGRSGGAVNRRASYAGMVWLVREMHLSHARWRVPQQFARPRCPVVMQKMILFALVVCTGVSRAADLSGSW